MAFDLPSIADLRSAAQTSMQSAAAYLTDFRAGSALTAVRNAAATLADSVIGYTTDRVAASFVDTAEIMADLEKRVVDFGGPTHLAASAATVVMTITADTTFASGFTISAGDEATGTAPDGREVTFTADADVTVLAGAASATVALTCTETGPRGNVDTGTLTALENAPSDGTLSHPRASGGADEETVDAYRARWKLVRRSFVRGTVPAIRAGALGVAGVASASVDETNRACADGGYVNAVVADTSGTAGATLLASVQAELESWRAAGVEVLAASAIRQEIAFALTVYRRSTSTVNESDVKTAFLEYLDSLRGGESHYAGAGESDVKAIDDAGIVSVKQTTPADEITTATSGLHAIRSASDGSGITVTFVEVA